MMKNDTSSAPVNNLARNIILVISIVLPSILLAYFLWSVGRGFLVIFSGILLAVLLDGIARVIRCFIPINHQIALSITFMVTALLIFGGGWLGSHHVAMQAPQLSKQISQSVNRINRQLMYKTSSFSQDNSRLSGTSKVMAFGKRITGNAKRLLSDTTSIISNGFIILILGAYFAVTPKKYLQIAASLIPPAHRDYVVEVLNTIGAMLRRWFLGQTMSMFLVGTLITIGLYSLGIELSLSLGIIAGIFTFIPYLGAIISALPAILVGLSSDLTMAIYVGILFLVVHIIEGYFFTPLIQKHIVRIAPAFLLIAQLLAGMFAGAAGVFLATPLVIIFTIGVQKFYLESFLGDLPHGLVDKD